MLTQEQDCVGDQVAADDQKVRRDARMFLGAVNLLHKSVQYVCLCIFALELLFYIFSFPSQSHTLSTIVPPPRRKNMIVFGASIDQNSSQPPINCAGDGKEAEEQSQTNVPSDAMQVDEVVVSQPVCDLNPKLVQVSNQMHFSKQRLHRALRKRRRNPKERTNLDRKVIRNQKLGRRGHLIVLHCQLLRYMI